MHPTLKNVTKTVIENIIKCISIPFFPLNLKILDFFTPEEFE